MTSQHTCPHTWPKALALVVIATYTSSFLLQVDATAKYELENSELTFPGKATWGYVKDIAGPIDISSGAQGSRRERSVSEDNEDVEILREGRGLWIGKSEPLFEDEGTVVSASLSIAGGELEINDQDIWEGIRPTTPAPDIWRNRRPVPLPRPPFRRRPFNFTPWFRKRFFAPQQVASASKMSEVADIQILQAGRLGDSPFVITRRLPIIRASGSSRSARLYDVQEESPQTSNTEAYTSNGNSSTDDSLPDVAEGTDMNGDNSSVIANSSESQKGGDANLDEDIEKALQNQTDQHTVSVQERHAESFDNQNESNDIQKKSNGIQKINNDLSGETSLQEVDTDSGILHASERDHDTFKSHSETSMPEDQGVNTHLYVNPAEGEEKFLLYFENEGQPNSSSLVSPAQTFFFPDAKQKSLKSQSSSRYTNDSKSYTRPRYIIVKEDPFDPLSDGKNAVDSKGESAINVQTSVSNTTKAEEPHMDPSQEDHYQNRDESKEESQTATGDMWNKSDETPASPSYREDTISHYTPYDQQMIIFPTTIKSVTQIETQPTQNPAEGESEPGEDPTWRDSETETITSPNITSTWRDSENETISPSHVVPRSATASESVVDSYWGHPKALLRKAEAGVSASLSKDNTSGSINTSPQHTYLCVLAVAVLWLGGCVVCLW